MNTANKGTEQAPEAGTDRLLFFNYHEHALNVYRAIDSTDDDFHEQALIVTHFPNTYAASGTEARKQTRIVRIARTFGTQGALKTTFSTRLPGSEEAAIVDEAGSRNFIIKGEYMGQFFGSSSVSPLSNHLTQEEFETIVSSVNALLANAQEAWSLWNLLEYTIGLLTLWFLGDALVSKSKKKLQEVEAYIDNLNVVLRNRDIQIISPRRSAYLSLDFQVPKPALEDHMSIDSSLELNNLSLKEA